MRALVLALALLAALKIWAQYTSFRSAAEQALVVAYRDRAVTACRNEPQKSRISPELAAFATDPLRAATPGRRGRRRLASSVDD